MRGQKFLLLPCMSSLSFLFLIQLVICHPLQIWVFTTAILLSFLAQFGSLTCLVELFVDNNQLTHLPESIGNLISLKTLSFSNNQLSHLPDSIGNLSNLTGLFVNNNQLTLLPDSIGNLAYLTHFYVFTNPITSSPAGKSDVRRRFERAGLGIVY